MQIAYSDYTRKIKLRYWAVNGFICGYLLLSAVITYTEVDGFKRLGFPDWFRVELAIAKLAGVIALLITTTPRRVREWVYIGYSICMISASFAHYFGGDPMYMVIYPLVGFLLVVLSIRYLDKLSNQEI